MSSCDGCSLNCVDEKCNQTVPALTPEELARHIAKRADDAIIRYGDYELDSDWRDDLYVSFRCCRPKELVKPKVGHHHECWLGLAVACVENLDKDS